jgi:hypothetical protein
MATSVKAAASVVGKYRGLWAWPAWNTREVTFRDLDGYLLTFTFGPLKNKSFDEVIGSMR